MGRQIIGLDTSIFAYVFNNHPEFERKAFAILNRVQTGKRTGVFSGVGLIELLTGIKKSGRVGHAIIYKEKIRAYPNLIIGGLDDSVIEIASNLRAKYGLRTPDAIHLATAIAAGASVFYTNDKRLRMVKEITVETL